MALSPDKEMTPSPKPTWWPPCPWPSDVFPLSREEYCNLVPDPAMRTAITGLLMRMGWEAAEETILERLERELHSRAISIEADKNRPRKGDP
jgi:hypothetical protein